MQEEVDRMEILLDHYKNPRNYGTIEDADISHEEGNATCGDVVRIDLKLEDGRVSMVRISGKGCAISQAAASILSEMIDGKTLEEIKKINMEVFLRELGVKLSPIRLKCALLPLKVLKTGVYGIREWPHEA
ncbi:MAG: iron-sulfur cluster assembly scaffold protein [Candidatus Caldarchaeum sp.]